MILLAAEPHRTSFPPWATSLVAAVFVTLLAVTAGAAPPSVLPVPLPGGGGGIGFDDLNFSPGLHRLLVPAGRSGNLDLGGCRAGIALRHRPHGSEAGGDRSRDEGRCRQGRPGEQPGLRALGRADG